MKRGLLIYPVFTDGKTDGVVIKGQGIEDAFRYNGIDLDVLKFRRTGIYAGQEQIYSFSSNRYIRAWQVLRSSWKVMTRYAVRYPYDFIWVRLPVLNPWSADFVFKVRKALPKCKLLIEYGAYPYENELSGFWLHYYRMNKRLERKTHSDADFIITYSGQKEVDGTPNIPIDNGIDLSGMPLARLEGDPEKTVQFISVSSLKKWHAIDRFLAGMPAYLQRGRGPAIHFHIVGTGAKGSELHRLQQMVRDLKLEQHVSFLGSRFGKELDEAYDGKHVAIGTLGFDRIGIVSSSSLKNREYFGRGLPVVLSTPDKDMPADLPFVRYVPGGEEPLDIEQLVEFAREICQVPDLRQQVRSYAERYISWNSKIKTVLQYLNGQPAEAEV